MSNKPSKEMMELLEEKGEKEMTFMPFFIVVNVLMKMSTQILEWVGQHLAYKFGVSIIMKT